MFPGHSRSTEESSSCEREEPPLHSTREIIPGVQRKKKKEGGPHLKAKKKKNTSPARRKKKGGVRLASKKLSGHLKRKQGPWPQREKNSALYFPGPEKGKGNKCLWVEKRALLLPKKKPTGSQERREKGGKGGSELSKSIILLDQEAAGKTKASSLG